MKRKLLTVLMSLAMLITVLSTTAMAEEEAAVAKIGEQGYETLADAVAVAQSGDTIELLADVAVEGTAQIPAGITIKSNGYTITGSIRMLGDLTLDGSLTITGGLWVGVPDGNLTATLAGDKLTANYFMFQRGTYTINADIDAVYGYLSYGGAFEVNSTITTTNTNGEPLYLNGNINLNRGAELNVKYLYLSNANTVLNVKEGASVAATDSVSITNAGAKLYSAGNITGTINNSANGTISITGGTYTTEYTAEASTYVPDGYKVTKTDNSWTVSKLTEAESEAQIGTINYVTLQGAVDAAKDGEVITVLRNVTLEETLTIVNKSLCIDFGKNTVSAADNWASGQMLIYVDNTADNTAEEVVFKNGTIDGKGVQHVLYVKALADGGDHSAELMFGTKDLTVKNTRDDGSYAAIILGYDVYAVFQTGTKIETVETGYSVQTSSGAVLVVYDGVTISHTANGKGVGAALSAGYDSSIEVFGGTISSDKYSLYALPTGGTISVSGGTFTGNVCAQVADNALTDAKILIAGGTFAGELEETGTDETYSAEILIGGGTFTANPDAYLAWGYQADEAEGTYTVTEDSYYTDFFTAALGVAKGEIKFYTLGEAFDAGDKNISIALLTDVTLSEPFKIIGKDFVMLELNGCQLANNNGAVLKVYNTLWLGGIGYDLDKNPGVIVGEGSVIEVCAPVELHCANIDIRSIDEDATAVLVEFEDNEESGEAYIFMNSCTVSATSKTLEGGIPAGGCVFRTENAAEIVLQDTIAMGATIFDLKDTEAEIGVYESISVACGKLLDSNSSGSSLKIYAGAFNENPTAYLANGKAAYAYDGWSAIADMPVNYIVATAGAAACNLNAGAMYGTLASAVAAAQNGDYIVLMANNAENVTVSRAVSFELDTNEYDFTGSITAGSGYRLSLDNGVYTVTKRSSSSGSSSSSSSSTTEVPKVDTSSPTVDTETSTDASTGSTTVTETKQDGTVVETTTNTDGSTSTTASKTETTTNKDGSTTTTTASKTETQTATGDKVTEEKVEETVENKDGSTTTTTTSTTETETASGEKVTVKAEEKVEQTEDKTTTTTTTETKSTETGLTVTEKKVEETVKDETTGEEVTTSTTETKSSDGSKSTTTVDETGKVEAEVTVSNTAVNNAEKDETPVALPMPAVEAGTDSASAPTVSVDVPASADSVKVEIPVEDVSPSTVVVIVDADGNETVVPSSAVTENGVVVELEEDATVKIVDNSKDFIDVADDHVLGDSIDFVSARGLFTGTTESTFEPNEDTTRGQVMTVLARLDGENAKGSDAIEKGTEWAKDSGISDGSNPRGSVTRQQLATMLWRMAGEPAPENADIDASDADDVEDYAKAALAWCIEKGIMKGYEDGTLGATKNASRAHVAAFVERYVNAIHG